MEGNASNLLTNAVYLKKRLVFVHITQLLINDVSGFPVGTLRFYKSLTARFPVPGRKMNALSEVFEVYACMCINAAKFLRRHKEHDNLVYVHADSADGSHSFAFFFHFCRCKTISFMKSNDCLHFDLKYACIHISAFHNGSDIF